MAPKPSEWPFRQQTAQLIGAVNSLDFSAAAPHDYVASAGTRLHIYDGASSAPKRQVTRFKDRAYGGSFRRDGKLIVAGGEDSVVQVRRLVCCICIKPLVQLRVAGWKVQQQSSEVRCFAELGRCCSMY